MLSTLIKSLMKECGLTQKTLAEVLGASLDRVKGLTSGRVQKLTRDESEALIRKLHVRGDWLATGVGPPLQSPKERELTRRMEAVRNASTKAGLAGLSPDQGRLVQEILYFVEIEDFAGLARHLPSLTAEEQLLVDRYRASPQPLRDAALRVLLGAEPGERPTKPKIKVTATGGQAAGRDIVNKGSGK